MKTLRSIFVPLLTSLALTLTLVAPALAQGGPPGGGFTVVAQGLNNPRGLAFGPDGTLYVAEAGKGGAGPCVKSPEGGQACYGTTGAITAIKDGKQSTIVSGLPSVAAPDGSQATGPAGIEVDSSGNVIVAVQGVDGETPKTFGAKAGALWHLIRLTGDGKYQDLADLFSYESAHNPDGREINSDPYAVVAVPGGWVVADAAANDLLRVGSDGSVSTLAVFPTRTEKGPGGMNVPMESVPDSVAVGPDGSYYVGELTGFPFPVGGARIYKVPATGGTPQVVASGFTNIIDLAFGSDGSMYVLEIFKNGLGNVNPSDPSTLAGALIRVASDGTRTTVASQGLVGPAGLAIAHDGSIYVSNFGVLAGAGQVVRVGPPAGTTGSATFSSAAPVTGQLTGRGAGVFNTYSFDYPGNGTVGTITLSLDFAW